MSFVVDSPIQNIRIHGEAGTDGGKYQTLTVIKS